MVLVPPPGPIARPEEDPARNLDAELLSIIQSAAGGRADHGPAKLRRRR
jgi:hypothetical protein